MHGLAMAWFSRFWILNVCNAHLFYKHKVLVKIRHVSWGRHTCCQPGDWRRVHLLGAIHMGRKGHTISPCCLCNYMLRVSLISPLPGSGRCRRLTVPARNEASWGVDDDWGSCPGTTHEEHLDKYFDEESTASYGYELVGGALALALLAAFLKVLWYLAIVCYTLVATALQYSIIAVTLISIVIFLG
jgi:hypothetical protein